VVEGDLVADEDVLAVAGLIEENAVRRRTTSMRCSRKARMAASSGAPWLIVVHSQEDHGEGLLHLVCLWS